MVDNNRHASIKKQISSSSELLSNNSLFVSCREVQIMSLLSSYNWLTNSELLLVNSHARADLFRFKHTINDKNTFKVFSFFQFFAIPLKTSCNSWTVSHSTTCICNVSNALTDGILRRQLMSASVHFPGAFKTVTLLFHITRFYSIGYIGEVCLNLT